MSTDFTLRPATPADLSHVLRLVRGLAEYEKLSAVCVATEADFHRHLFGPDAIAHAALAEAAGEIVGLALWYYRLSTFAGRRRLFVEDVFVDERHRGSGIGYALFQHMARIARAKDCVAMEWSVLNWNKPAIDFYDRIGATQPAPDWSPRHLQGDALAALAS